MATFRVGQRVRIKPYRARPAAFGRILEIDAAKNAFGEECHRLEVDGHPQMNICAWGWLVPIDILEPIQPERNQTIAWSECLWMPEHLREVTA